MLIRRPIILTLVSGLLFAGLLVLLSGLNDGVKAKEWASSAGEIGEWLRLTKIPKTQYVQRGEAAVFDIIVLNTSQQFVLRDIEISDALAPNCSRTREELTPNGDFSYRCTKEDIQVPFTNEAKVTGFNATNGKSDSASDTARVEVLDLQVAVVPDPAALVTPGGPVAFSVKVTNLSSVDAKLTMLASAQFGDLADPLNELVRNNTCAISQGPPELSKEGGALECGFTFDVSGSAGERVFKVDARGEVTESVSIEASGTAVVKIYDVFTLSLTAGEEQVVAGKKVELLVSIENLDEITGVRILALDDAILGDVSQLGDCTLPQFLAPSSSYSCTYSQTATAAPGDEQSFILTAAAETDTTPATQLRNQASATILVAEPMLYLPILKIIPKPTSCAAPLLIETNTSYQFYPDTRNAVYHFVLIEEADVVVELSEFTPRDGQVTVYKDTGNGCDPETLEFLGSDGSNNLDRKVSLGRQEAGNYYIHVFSGSDLSQEQAYTLLVQAR